MNTIKSIFGLCLFILIVSSSCVKTEFDEPPAILLDNIPEVTHTIADLAAIHVSGAFEALEAGTVIEGIVTSSDETGNFYKEIFIEDGTAGVILSIDVTNLFNSFPVGRKVYVKCDGLTLSDDNGALIIGGGTYLDDGEERLSRMSEIIATEAIVKGEFGESPTPNTIAISDINSSITNTLVRLEDVQFVASDAGQTYADGAAQFDLNRFIEDCDGNQIIIRSSGYSNFANELTPQGRGSITAVLSVYRSDFQLYIRDLSDIDMTGNRCGVEEIDANTTLAELAAMHTEGSFENLDEGTIIEGTVISSDESGNFYKELFIQDGTAGIILSVDKTDLYANYPVGQKIAVKCGGLTLGDDNGALMLGEGTYTDNGGNERLSRMLEITANSKIVKSSTIATPDVTTLSISDVNSSTVNTLIRLEDVQFIDDDAGETFADASNLFDLNRMIEDCEGNSIILRSSGYSDFADASTPGGKGTIVGVLSVYQSAYQLYIRDLSDVNMTANRCDGSSGGGGGGSGSGGSGDVVWQETFDGFEDFDVLNIPGWYNIAEVGSDEERWFKKSYQGENYAEVSAYQSVDDENLLWLITPPIELNSDTYFSFSSNQHHWVQDGFSVWITNDFNGSDTESANWEELDCDLPTEANDWYEWIDSGTIKLNDYFSSGTVHVGFRYEGANGAGQTSSYQLDNVTLMK